MPPSDPLDDPLRNARVGCLWPIARSMMSVIGMFLIAVMVTLATGNGNWFFIIMIGSIPLFWVLDKFASPDRKRREKQAANRLFGIPDEDS